MIAPLSLGSLAASLLVVASPSPSMADLYVDVFGANCSSGDGTLGNPVCSISAAIGLALPGDTIFIAPGTYVENVVIGVDLDLVGTGGASVTTLDGGAMGSVVTIPSAVTVTIDGLTIQNGDAMEGGGIDLGNAGTLSLTSSTITGNRAQWYGGGISANPGSSLNVESSTFSGNSVTGSVGGAVSVREATATIQSSTFTGNLSYGGGSGIFFSGSNPAAHILTVESSTFEENGPSATNVFCAGAAVRQLGGSLAVSGSTFVGNTAWSASGGALAMGSGCEFTIANSTIVDNRVVGWFYLQPANGGGVYASDASSGTITNSTITGNVVEDGWGGGVSVGSNSGVVSVENSIVAENLASQEQFSPVPPPAPNDTFGTLNSLGFNLIGTGGTGFNNGVLGDLAGTPAAPLAPRLGPLQSNGGPTETRAVRADSPALDAANPLAFPATDQRGVARPFYGGPDVGAFEAMNFPVAFCFGDGSGTTCPCANSSSAGHPGGCANSVGDGAVLSSTGLGLVSADSLRFDLSSASWNSFALLVSGDNQLPQVGGCMGCGIGAFDGLRCAGGNFIRHGSRATNALGETSNGWGPPDGPAGGLLAASGLVAGQTRHFFAFYRDDVSLVCQTGQNSSNGLSVNLLP